MTHLLKGMACIWLIPLSGEEELGIGKKELGGEIALRELIDSFGYRCPLPPI
jgi:hypothetical protein